MSITYKGVKRGYGATMPSAISRRHEPVKYGDAQSAIRRSKGKALDTNTQVVKVHWGPNRVLIYLVVLGHWGYVGRDGYTHYIGRDGKRHKLSDHQRAMSYQEWIDANGGTLADLNRLRKRGSRFSLKREDYPMSWGQAIRYADPYNALMIPELKDTTFAYKRVVAYMKDACEKYDYPLWPMKLIWQAKAKEVVAAFIKAGEQIAIIFGNKRRLAEGRNLVADWDHKPTRVWGPLPARRWIAK